MEFKTLEELKQHCLQCSACDLRKSATQVVFGEGNPNATMMLIGEAPGAQEDKLGRPFVGPAGQLLDKILAAINLRREEVYIANIAKCRPPRNRLPRPAEVAACRKYVEQQIELIKPQIIVLLGALATKTLVHPDARITRMRGNWIKKDDYWMMPTFHPAALLRDASKKRPVWEDFKQIRDRLQAIDCG